MGFTWLVYEFRSVVDNNQTTPSTAIGRVNLGLFVTGKMKLRLNLELTA